jgi:nitrate reductase NapE component
LQHVFYACLYSQIIENIYLKLVLVPGAEGPHRIDWDKPCYFLTPVLCGHCEYKTNFHFSKFDHFTCKQNKQMKRNPANLNNLSRLLISALLFCVLCICFPFASGFFVWTLAMFIYFFVLSSMQIPDPKSAWVCVYSEGKEKGIIKRNERAHKMNEIAHRLFFGQNFFLRPR